MNRGYQTHSFSTTRGFHTGDQVKLRSGNSKIMCENEAVPKERVSNHHFGNKVCFIYQPQTVFRLTH